jgi:hypothetical protein
MDSHKSEPPTFHHAKKVIHCSVEGEEDLIEVFTDDAWLVIAIDRAEIIRRDYRVRREGLRWHPPLERTQ